MRPFVKDIWQKHSVGRLWQAAWLKTLFVSKALERCKMCFSNLPNENPRCHSLVKDKNKTFLPKWVLIPFGNFWKCNMRLNVTQKSFVILLLYFLLFFYEKLNGKTFSRMLYHLSWRVCITKMNLISLDTD